MNANVLRLIAAAGLLGSLAPIAGCHRERYRGDDDRRPGPLAPSDVDRDHGWHDEGIKRDRDNERIRGNYDGDHGGTPVPPTSEEKGD